MQRIMIIGCCGSGKSTFARKLHNIIGIELIHLDQHYWKPNWQEPERENWARTVQQLAARSEWIIDGNYNGTIESRIARADTIIYLDHSTWRCLWRITKRILKYRGTERPDMPEGCEERFDLGFYHYVATYNILRRKKLLERLEKLKAKKEVVVLKNDKATAAYLSQLSLNL